MYRWDARDYARSSSAQQRWARELIGLLQLQGHERVLDIGCGDGKVTAELAALVPQGSVVGVDSSPAMIEHARSSHSARFANLSFQEADARTLPFHAEFDVVFSNAVLHWVVDHRPVLAGIHRSLRSPGRMLVQMGGRGNGAEVVEIIQTLLEDGEWAGYFSGFQFPYGFHGPEEYRVWLREAGFEPRRVELIPKNMVQEGKAAFEGWLRTTWLPYTQRVPEEHRERFVALIADRFMAARGLAGTDPVEVRMVRLEAEAVK